MPETACFTALVAGNEKKAALDMTRVLEVNFDPVDATAEDRVQYGLISKKIDRQHGRQLLGTASCWFLLGMAFLLFESVPEGYLLRSGMASWCNENVRH